MSAALHLLPVPDAAQQPKIESAFLVAQRQNGHWSPAAKVLHVMETEWLAEDMAAKLKEQHPQQSFGVFMLRSEARAVPNPVETVRVET